MTATTTRILLLSLLLTACSGRNSQPDNSRIDDFLSTVESMQSTVVTDDAADRFMSLFGDMAVNGSDEDIIRSLYADEFYFNDTFKTIRELDELIIYFDETAANVHSIDVELLDVVAGQDDYYLRWVMDMHFEAGGRDIHSRSIGVTQLRFDADGRIILHQDYWDGAEAFYRHLPVVGYLVRKVQSRL